MHSYIYILFLIIITLCILLILKGIKESTQMQGFFFTLFKPEASWGNTKHLEQIWMYSTLASLLNML